MNQVIGDKKAALLSKDKSATSNLIMPDTQEKGLELPELLTTSDAANYLNRAPQTLRKWACLGIGPIQPIRIFGRLSWKRSDLLALLGENHGG